MFKHLDIKIFGFVQRVFFRDSAHRKANKFSIKGFIRNEPDGTVYIEAEGKESDLKEFLEWCRGGPILARVRRIEIHESEICGYDDFIVEL